MGYPGTKVWTGCMAAPSVCVTSGLCHNLWEPLLYIAEGSEDRSKAGGTLHHVPCAALASAAACGGRRDHAGTQESFLSGCHVLSILSRYSTVPTVQHAIYRTRETEPRRQQQEQHGTLGSETSSECRD